MVNNGGLIANPPGYARLPDQELGNENLPYDPSNVPNYTAQPVSYNGPQYPNIDNQGPNYQ